MSLLTFSVAQGVIDVQVVYRILNQVPNPHGWTHTLLGTLVVAAASVAITVPAVTLGERVWRRLSARGGSRWITWPSAWCGALLGAGSHILLDSIMHNDVRPLWPLADASPLYSVMSIRALHELCFWLGGAGSVAWVVTSVWRLAHRGERANREALYAACTVGGEIAGHDRDTPAPGGLQQ